VVQTLPSNRADESLGVWILPGTSRCSEHLLDAQRLDSQSNFSTVPAVAIADEILGGLSVCERLYDLLRRPSPGRMLRHIEMQHLATIVFQEDKYEQLAPRVLPAAVGTFMLIVGHGKEIDGDHLGDMVVQEGPSPLARWPPEPAQDARHGALGDGDAEHLQLAMNPGCAPQRIGGGYLLDQSAEFCGCAGAASTLPLRVGQPGPEFAEPFALPTDDGVCLDIKQGMSPVGPHAAENDPKYPIQARQQRALPFSLKHRYLHS
jgi:hypothetical protein